MVKHQEIYHYPISKIHTLHNSYGKLCLQSSQNRNIRSHPMFIKFQTSLWSSAEAKHHWSFSLTCPLLQVRVVLIIDACWGTQGSAQVSQRLYQSAQIIWGSYPCWRVSQISNSTAHGTTTTPSSISCMGTHTYRQPGHEKAKKQKKKGNFSTSVEAATNKPAAIGEEDYENVGSTNTEDEPTNNGTCVWYYKVVFDWDLFLSFTDLDFTVDLFKSPGSNFHLHKTLRSQESCENYCMIEMPGAYLYRLTVIIKKYQFVYLSTFFIQCWFIVTMIS